MSALALELLVLLGAAAGPLGPGDYQRVVVVADAGRSYLLHVPPKYDPKKPTPVVLSLHGAWPSAAARRLLRTQQQGRPGRLHRRLPERPGDRQPAVLELGVIRSRPGAEQADDVQFIAKVLDDVSGVVHVDPKRVYATGMSNGGMMCYRLAAELSDRIAAIAPVSGTLSMDVAKLKRPVPVMHFHGTADTLVPYNGRNDRSLKFLNFKSVEETMAIWAGSTVARPSRRSRSCPTRPTTAPA